MQYPPYNNFQAVTVGAADIYPDGSLTHALYVGTGGGSITVMDQAGNTTIFELVNDGEILPIAVKRVTAAVTADDIVALRRV